MAKNIRDGHKSGVGSSIVFRTLKTETNIKVAFWDDDRRGIISEWSGSGRLFEQASFHINRGVIACRRGDMQAAQVDFDEAVRLCPDMRLTNLAVGYGLLWRSEFQAAELAFKSAIKFSSGDMDSHFCLALAYLGQGKLDDGWREYESRPDLNETTLNPAFLKRDRWRGEPLDGKRILIYGEQGHGDVFQFMRYIRVVKERGAGHIIFACLPESIRALERLPHIDELVSCLATSMPEYDVQAPLLSLPMTLGRDTGLLAETVPYLTAHPDEIDAWREQLDPLPGHKVGIVWAGNAKHYNDSRRSASLADLAPLAQIDGVTVFSLQKGSPAGQIVKSPSAVDYVPSLGDFADTAALIMALDLVITVDTSVAHLAGALGKPVWILLPHAAEWRWMQSERLTPWYPTMRLWRQKREGDWTEVIQRVVCEIEASINFASSPSDKINLFSQKGARTV